MASAEYNEHYDRIIQADGNPYQILDVPERADDEKIRSRYKKLALLFHVRLPRLRCSLCTGMTTAQPDRVKRMASGKSDRVADDLKTRSDQAFRLIGLACALLLDRAASPHTRVLVE